MQTFWKPAATVALLVIGSVLGSCQSKPAEQPAATTEAAAPAASADSTTAPVATAAYICPMGCEGSASNTPGKCPVCGMDLEANTAAKPAASL
ncbi:heavy metal-binding domain-containing protein [Hymenobacter seoulensis]